MPLRKQHRSHQEECVGGKCVQKHSKREYLPQVQERSQDSDNDPEAFDLTDELKNWWMKFRKQ
jgi:hypothetical protein